MTVAQLNKLDLPQRAATLRTCCGSSTWIESMQLLFPVADEAALLAAAETAWVQCSKADWKEAFTHHPKIGDINSLKEKYAATREWAAGEQAAVEQGAEEVLQALALGNSAYEKKFGYIFIVCATGKSAAVMLQLLEARLENSPAAEIYIAMREQGKITALRLKKLLAQ